MSDREQRVVIRWRTRSQAEALAPALGRAYPPDDAAGFEEALKAIDEAEQKVWGNAGAADETPE